MFIHSGSVTSYNEIGKLKAFRRFLDWRLRKGTLNLSKICFPVEPSTFIEECVLIEQFPDTDSFLVCEYHSRKQDFSGNNAHQ